MKRHFIISLLVAIFAIAALSAAQAVPEVHEGLFAAKFSNTGEGAFVGDTAFDMDNARIDVAGLTTLNISVWMRSGNATPSDIVSFGIASYAADGAHLPGYGEVNIVDGAATVGVEWEKRSIVYTVPGADVNFINIGMRVQPGSSIVIDDLQVVDADTGNQLKDNGGYEAWGNGGVAGTIVAADGVPDNFRVFAVADADGNATIERLGSETVAAVQDGEFAAKFSNTGEGDFVGDTGFDMDNARIDIAGLTTLNISWWTRSGNDTPSDIVSFGIAPFSADGVYLGAYGEPNIVDGAATVGTTWEYRSFEYTVPGADVNFINIGLRVMPGSSIVLDDFRVVDAATGNQLKDNGSYEAWGNGGVVGTIVAADGVPDNFRVFAVADADGKATIEKIAVEADVIAVVHEGLYAVKVSNTGTGDFVGDMAFDYDNARIDVTGLTTINVSWWTRSGNATPSEMVTYGIAPFAADGAYLGGGDYGEPSMVEGATTVGVEWEQRTYVYTIPGADVAFLNMGLRVMPGSSIVLDDFQVTDADTGNVLKPNGGFEAWGNGAVGGTVVAPDGVPDEFRMFAVADADGLGKVERVSAPVNAVSYWTLY